MKIIICSSYFLPHRGGVENYVYQTAKRLVKRGYKIWVITSRLPGMKKQEVIDGIQVIRLPALEPLPDRMTLPVSLVSSVIHSIGKVDAIITHTRFYPLTLAAGFHAHRHGIPWLHIEHGTKQDYDNPIFTAVSRVVDATVGRWILRHAHVAGVSKAACAFVKGMGAQKCEILYNGVDTKFFDGKKKSHKGVKIVFVGRLTRDKGVHDLLKASKDVTVVGRGPYESELKRLGGRFVGEKDSKGVRDILSQSDILVNPSYGEGLPTAVLEAGAMGLAVVATDVGGTKEIVDDGKSGFLVKAGDVGALREKISILVKNSKLREKFGSALQKTVRKSFDWDKITLGLERMLKSL